MLKNSSDNRIAINRRFSINLFDHRIVAALRKGVASQDSTEAVETTVKKAVFCQRLLQIVRARRIKSAVLAQ